MMMQHYILKIVSLLCLFIGMIQPVFAVDISEKIKAAYIYNLLQFVTFPEAALQSKSKLNVCIVGDNNFGNILNKIEGESTPQAKIHFIFMGNYSSNLSFRLCNVLYLTKAVKNDSKKVLDGVDHKEIVTIADYSPFVADGGLIELFTENGKIRFRINRDLVKITSFKVESQLIMLGSN